MKAYRFLAPWVCLLLAGMSSLQGNTMASSNKTDYEAVDEYITARMRSDRIPGVALAIVKGDQIVYVKGYGRADQSGRPVTPQTPFLIGSITKPFTSLAVMQLVEAGKVELDAPVQRYIPWFRVANTQVFSICPAFALHVEGMFGRSLDPLAIYDEFGEDFVCMGEGGGDFVVSANRR